MAKKQLTIQDLKKHDQFVFNGITYTVHKKYRNDNSPLITECGELSITKKCRLII